MGKTNVFKELKQNALSSHLLDTQNIRVVNWLEYRLIEEKIMEKKKR